MKLTITVTIQEQESVWLEEFSAQGEPILADNLTSIGIEVIASLIRGALTKRKETLEPKTNEPERV